ncbi:homocysteine S-methyltransferase [Aurantimicrobium minutum]|uniref:homocysteine S-methyltransferase n=1 Tax=Aurantimicrobium minutum TaxID=708131 RepID=UPI00240730F1|nr:homocysteine S-methyltransferase [Aurantimicrobium minutum]MDF9809704.1 homocysteine S-methyltransferase [Aurantimicrobium minutum]
MLTREEFLARVRVPLAIDGGMSTELEQQGCRLEGSLWTAQALLDDPGLIEAAHKAYVDAGAGVVITASYQISRAGFVEAGLTANDADRALRASIDVARKAVAGTQTLVAASVGPYGAILHDGSEYKGNYGKTVDELRAFHAERLAVLLSANPDLLAIETIPDALEAEALVAALAEFPSAIAWMSFSIGPDGKLWAGQSLAEAARIAASSPAIAAIGVNCVDPALVSAAIAEIRSVTDLPVVIYANGGGTWNSETGIWENAAADALVAYSAEWITQGATLIGGCCGTHSGDIRQLAQAL